MKSTFIVFVKYALRHQTLYMCDEKEALKQLRKEYGKVKILYKKETII